MLGVAAIAAHRRNEEMKEARGDCAAGPITLWRSADRTQARLRYEPSEVLMMIFSPVVMNGGTRVFRPVSQVASFS
jgi:hypothetical protein